MDSATKQILLAVGRRGLERFVREHDMYRPDLRKLPLAVSQPRCSFVTLTDDGRLRGCIGSTEAQRPLAEDVAYHAAAAARDPRFAPVKPTELGDIRLAVTILSPPQPLPYADYDDLLARLRPEIDGLILAWEGRRGVLLPQVWRRILEPARFVTILARKAGIPEAELRRTPTTITALTFQAEHFEEAGYQEPGDLSKPKSDTNRENE